MISAVNLKSIYLELLNQCSKHLLNMKHVPGTVLRARMKTGFKGKSVMGNEVGNK